MRKLSYHRITVFCLISYCIVIIFRFTYHDGASSNTNVTQAYNETLVNLLKNTASNSVSTATFPSLMDLSKAVLETSQTAFPPFYLLCVTFLMCSVKDVENFMSRFRMSTGQCHWAILCYGGDFSAAPVLTGLLKMSGFQVVHMNSSISRLDLMHDLKISGTGLPYNHIVYPKILLMLQLRELFALYHRIWIMDDDISLEGFDCDKFLRATECAFYPNIAPILAQPLVAENTQTYKYMNLGEWTKYQRQFNLDILVSASGFIEIQMPFVSGTFLGWYLKAIAMRLAEPAHILGADWGFDSMFCNAATLFAKNTWNHEQKRRYRSSATANDTAYHRIHSIANTSINPCVMVVGVPPVHHLNTKNIDHLQGRKAKVALNKHMMSIAARAFPDLFLIGTNKSASPISREYGHLFPKVANIDPRCKVPRGPQNRYVPPDWG